MTNLPRKLLDAPIGGVNLHASTLGEQIGAGNATLLVFLRHYGCIFCKEMVRDLKSARESIADYPDLLFFGQGDLQETKAFADKIWPEIPLVSDSDRQFFTGMGLGKGSVYQMFGPSVWACGIRAGLKGNFQWRVIGDIWTMPGVFAVNRSGEILWKHEFEHIAEHPDWKKIPSLLASLEKKPQTAKQTPAPVTAAT
jgi:hypothetical protein